MSIEPERSHGFGWEPAAGLLFWVSLYLFLLACLRPGLIVQDIVPTGGDMAGHYPALEFLSRKLLPHGRLVGWYPGNYAGFPLFQMYFPLPFLLMAGLGLILPLTVSFKMIGLAGVFLLPAASHRALKIMKCPCPAPKIGAAAALAFLFNEGNSAWGGNLLSVLAGEFAFSLSLFLAVIYLARMYRDVPKGDNAAGNALLLASTGLSHGYPLLFCLASVVFFLFFSMDWKKKFIYLLKVNLGAFGLMAFWLVPLLLYSPYTTPFNFIWRISGWRLVLPVILWPFALAALAGGLRLVFPDRLSPETRMRSLFFIWLIVVAAALYLLAFKIGLVDIRFIPFGQLSLVLFGAAFLGEVVSRFRFRSVIPVMACLAVMVWAGHGETRVSDWAAWNYSGFSSKPLWPLFRDVTDFLKGDSSEPRVVYEHNRAIEGAGTVRAFELLPFFSGRSTLEGVYIQASLSAPAVFHIQSEVSLEISAPLVQYNYSRFDLERALPHLRLFNVGHYITVTPEARLAAERHPAYRLVRQAGPFTVFEISGGHNRYVVQPEYKPVAALTDDPKAWGFQWLRQGRMDAPLILCPVKPGGDPHRFAATVKADELTGKWDHWPLQPLDRNAELKESLTDDEIIIENAVPGRPLWVKMSYHPKWEVEGARKIWRTAPAFMMVFPTSRTVRLKFVDRWQDRAGAGAYSSDRAVYFGRVASPKLRSGPTRPRPPEEQGRNKILAVFEPVAGFGDSPWRLYFCFPMRSLLCILKKGLAAYDRGSWPRARAYFEKSIDKFPYSPVVGQTIHHLALTYYREGRPREALAAWARFRDYPESRSLPEALYHVGLCYQALGDSLKARLTFAPRGAGVFIDPLGGCGHGPVAGNGPVEGMKVLLVNPAWPTGRAGQKRYGRAWPPLDLLNAAALLLRGGHRVMVVDLRANPHSARRSAGTVRSAAHEADLIILQTTPLDRWQCPNLEWEALSGLAEPFPKHKLFLAGAHGLMRPAMVLEMTGAKALITG